MPNLSKHHACLFLSIAAMFVLPLAAVADPLFGLEIRRSVVNEGDLQKPAQVQVTWPDEGKTHYAIDLGVTAFFATERVGETQWDFGAVGELHKRTLVDKEQDTLLVGLTTLGLVGDISQTGWSLLPQATLRFKRDRVKGTEGIVALIDSGLASKSLHLGDVFGPPEFGILLQPRLGLVYEDVTEAEGDKPTGQVLRTSNLLDLALYPANEALKQRLEMVLTYQHWYDLTESQSIDDGSDSHDLFVATLRYYLDSARNLSLAVSRLDGENVTEGLPEQVYTQVVFEFKLTLPGG